MPLFPFLCHELSPLWLIWMTAVGSSSLLCQQGSCLAQGPATMFLQHKRRIILRQRWTQPVDETQCKNMALNKHQSVHTHLSWHNSLVQWNMTLSLRYPFYHPIFLWSITVAGWVRTTPLQNLQSSIVHPCLIKVYLHSSSNLFLSIHHHVIHR